MKQKKVLLLGSYGQSNLGDDLLMWNYLELLRKRGFTEIYVNANTTDYIPEPIKKTYPDLHILDTYHTSVFDYLRIIKQVDCVVYGGGTLYKELYRSTGRAPHRVIASMMVFNIVTRLLGTKLYHLHIGIGSLKTALGRLITKIALNAATFTIFRDQKSYDFAKGTLAIPPHKITKSTDGLFINSIWQQPWRQAYLKIDRKKYKRVVGINVLSDIPDWVDRSKYIAVIRKFVKELLDAGDYVVFIPFQHAFNPRNDLVFTKETFADIVKDKQNYTILESVPIDLVGSYLQQCDVFVGMRFHSLLLAAAQGVPFVAIAYDTKCWRFIEEIQYPFAVELERLDAKRLMDLYHGAAGAGTSLTADLDAAVTALYAEAEEGLRTLRV